jgi:hypothetical protein
MPNLFDLTLDTPRKRPRKAGDFPARTRILWLGVLEAERILLKGGSLESRLKAIHALATIGGAYARILEVMDLSARLTALEQRNMESLNGKIHTPSDLVVECVMTHRKPPEVRIWRLRNQSRVGTLPPSTSTPARVTRSFTPVRTKADLIP